MLIKYQPPLGLDLSLLPDGVLGEEFIGGGERRVVMNIRVSFQQIPKGRSELRQPGFSFFLLFGLQAVSVLRRSTPPSVNTPNRRSAQFGVVTFCHAAFFSANVFNALYSGSVMIVRIV